MTEKRILIALAIMLIATVSVVHAGSGTFIQSPLAPEGLPGSFAAQLGISASDAGIPDNAVLQAIGSTDYPVTPGDTFVLSYSDGRSLVSLDLQADSDCTVAIPSVATVEAFGMTYKEFKKTVETLISTYYPYSSPQLVLTGCGVFSVLVSGEVSHSCSVTAWGLSRLSDLVVYASSYASTREVTVTYADGSTCVYDLYEALRNSSRQDNPLLVPGCEVSFAPAQTTVSISGAVRRQGVYQSLEGQTVYDLVMDYGKGLDTSADSGSISVANFSDGVYVVSTMSLEEARTAVLKDGDAVTVPSNGQLMPYVTVTGAISSVAGDSSLSAASKVMYSFVPGETAQQMIRSISSMLLPTSDISSVYILRDGQKISFDASQALSGNEKGDIVLQQGDTVVIPFSQLTVTVTGAVNKPGTFAYVPDRTADYYINLAGGYSSSATERYKVLDREGEKLKTTYVPADSTIVAAKSNLTANIAITASVVSLVATILSIIIDVHTISNY